MINTGKVIFMCQSIAEGGRRCDCLKGSEKRRARQNARYRAKKQNEKYAQSIHEEDEASEGLIDEDVVDTSTSEVFDVNLDDVDEDFIDELSVEDKQELRQRARQEFEVFEKEKNEIYETLVKKSIKTTFSLYDFDDSLSVEEMIDRLSDEDKNSGKLNLALSLKNQGAFNIDAEELAFEQSTRDCGNALRVAAMITAEEIIEDKGLTVENYNDDEYIKNLLLTHPEGEDTPFMLYKKEAEQHQERVNNYISQHSKKGEINIIEDLRNDRGVDPKDFADFVYETLAMKQKRKGSSKFYALDGDMAKVLDSIYDDWATETNNPDFSVDDMIPVELDRKKTIKGFLIGRKSVSNDKLMTPRGMEMQKFVMEKLVNYTGEGGGELSSVDRFVAKDIMNKELASVFGEAVKKESGKSFDNEKLQAARENKNIEDSDRRDFDFASSCFPDSLVASAKSRHHKVSFMRDNGFMRGNTYVSKRAFFQRNGTYKESRDIKDAPFKFDYDFMGRRIADSTSFNVFDVDDVIAEKAATSKMFYNIHYKDEKYPPVSNTELVEELTKYVNDHNNGDTDTVVRSNENSSKSAPAQLRTKEFTDPRGVKRIAIVADVKRKETIHTAEIHTDGNRDTTLHEMGHYMEADPQVWKACKAFLHRRTQGLEKTVYHKSHRGKEMTVTDGFYSSYVGKDYQGRENTEVFSMGMEAVFCPDSISRNEEKSITNGIIGYQRIGDGYVQDFTPHHEDREHLNLILGIIGSHNKDAIKGKLNI